MSRRSPTNPRLDLPPELVQLVDAEGTDLDLTRYALQFAAIGVEEVSLLGDSSRPSGIHYRTPGHSGHVDVLYDEWDNPVSTAMEELLQGLRKFDLLVRLHIALTDLELIIPAARTLADHREDKLDLDHWLAELLEAGIVTNYGRAFIGRAKLPDRWRPESEADREIHRRLIQYRHDVVAHADFTPARTLIDTNAALGIEGPQIWAEARTPLSGADLRAIADMCERQYERFWIKTGELKLELGSPATI